MEFPNLGMDSDFRTGRSLSNSGLRVARKLVYFPGVHEKQIQADPRPRGDALGNYADSFATGVT